jgi:hypothetical protein
MEDFSSNEFPTWLNEWPETFRVICLFWTDDVGYIVVVSFPCCSLCKRFKFSISVFVSLWFCFACFIPCFIEQLGQGHQREKFTYGRQQIPRNYRMKLEQTLRIFPPMNFLLLMICGPHLRAFYWMPWRNLYLQNYQGQKSKMLSCLVGKFTTCSKSSSWMVSSKNLFSRIG